MSEQPFIIWSAVAAVVTLGLLAALAAADLKQRRNRSRDAVLSEKYLQIVMSALLAENGAVPRFPLIRRAGARRLLAETIAGVVGVTYGLDTTPLKRIVDKYELDEWLLRRISSTRGCRRARYLALLAQLPVDVSVAARVAHYSRSRNPYVRFYAFMAQLALKPSSALRLMTEFPAPFSDCEVIEIMNMLRRGMLPIAYEPLVVSPFRNLRVVGLGIIRQFGIEEAEKHLLRIAAGDESPELGREALYTLCSMRRQLPRREIGGRIASMSLPERKALMRYMATEGYSPSELRLLFDKREHPYYESLVQSYKRCLACR